MGRKKQRRGKEGYIRVRDREVTLGSSLDAPDKRESQGEKQSLRGKPHACRTIVHMSRIPMSVVDVAAKHTYDIELCRPL